MPTKPSRRGWTRRSKWRSTAGDPHHRRSLSTRTDSLGRVGPVGSGPRMLTPMSGTRRRASAPAPGQAPLVAPNAAALLRRNAAEHGDRPAIHFGDRTWTHGDYYAESCRFANLFRDRLPAEGPRHVAILLDNTPDYLFAFGGAALIGAAIVGLNHTRRGEHLL